MKQALLIAVVALVSLSSFAQKGVSEYAAIDKKTLEIPASQTKNTQDIAKYINASFTTEKEKIRAIFIWVASNLEYDIENMYAFNPKETREEKIAKSLKSGKGICENYAAVFNDISNKCGIKSYIVVGYSRQAGQTSFIRHGWCAAKVDDVWRLFDPTWGSGYVNDNKFTPKINNEYFMADPKALIKTHMPFDPVWQFLNYPVTNREFTDGRTDINKSKPFFSYPDTIEVYGRLSEVAQFEAEARRLEQNGISSEVVHDRLTSLRNAIEVHEHNEQAIRQNKIVEAYNSAVDNFNEGVNDLNAFINYRNKQFTPVKTDEAIQAMLDKAENKITGAENKLRSLKGGFDKIDEMMGAVLKSIDEAEKVLDDQKAFLAEYFTKSKLGRKTMFRKYTWMGIPLN